MITNLFSIFDPASRIISIHLNWIRLILGFFYLVYNIWIQSNRRLELLNWITNIIYKEIKSLVILSNGRILLIFLRLFIIILFNNVLGLTPYVFTSTSHLAITIALSAPLWIGIFINQWFYFLTPILAHLTPLGTPRTLIPLIVIIERVRRLIRPFTLAVRLAANIIAGHLLLALVREAIRVFSPLSITIIIILQVLLLSLEIAVAVIQSYVFTLLITLYSREVYESLFKTSISFSWYETLAYYRLIRSLLTNKRSSKLIQ